MERKSPFDYLTPLSKNLYSIHTILSILESACLSRIERWWTYEFCFDRHFRQFHEDQEEHLKKDFILGLLDPNTEQDDEIRVPSFYLSKRFSGRRCRWQNGKIRSKTLHKWRYLRYNERKTNDRGQSSSFAFL